MLRPHPPTFQIVGPGAVESEWAKGLFPENGWRHCGDSIPTIFLCLDPIISLHHPLPLYPTISPLTCVYSYFSHLLIFPLYVHIFSIMLRSHGFLAPVPGSAMRLNLTKFSISMLLLVMVFFRASADLCGSAPEPSGSPGTSWWNMTNFIQLLQVSNISPNIKR